MAQWRIEYAQHGVEKSFTATTETEHGEELTRVEICREISAVLGDRLLGDIPRGSVGEARFALDAEGVDLSSIKAVEIKA